MGEAMSDERLAHISGCLSAPCEASLAEAFAHELLAEVKRLRDVETEVNNTLREYGFEYPLGARGVRDVAIQRNCQLERAETAERELAELRERIGETREEWGVRTYDNDDDTEVLQTREQAEDLAAAWRTEIPNSNPTVRVRTQCAPGPWRDAEDGDRG